MSNLILSYPVIYVALTAVIVLITLILEKQSKVIGYISASVVVIFLGSFFTTLGITPTYAPIYDSYFTYFMPVASILFVLKFDVVWLFKNGKRITFMFLCTAVSTFVFVTLLGLMFNFPEVEKITGGIIAEYIGGPQNLFAVKEATALDEVIFARYLFADNVWAIFAMMIIFLIPSFNFISRFFRRVYGERADASLVFFTEKGEHSKVVTSLEDSVSLRSIFIAIGISLALLAIVIPFCAWAGSNIKNVVLNQLLSTPLVVSPFAALFVSIFFKKSVQEIEGEDTIAYFIYLMTLLAIGSYVDLKDVLSVNPSYFLILIFALIINIGFSLLLGKIFKIPYEELCLSIAASYAGPGEAFVVAKNQKWYGHVRLGIMIGMLGYIIGSIFGVLSVNILLWIK